MPNSCKGCKYWRNLETNSIGLKCCHYMLDTGESKNCRADNCDKKEIDPRYAKKRQQQWSSGGSVEKPVGNKFKFRK